MHIECPKCQSTHLNKRGTARTLTNIYQRFVCKSCSSFFQSEIIEIDNSLISETDINPSKKLIDEKVDFELSYPNRNGMVVTSALNDTSINTEFFESLKNYCEVNNFELMIIKNRYINPTMYQTGELKKAEWPSELSPYFLSSTLQYRDVLKVIGDCNIQATATHPLTGIDGLCEGLTTIVGHPVLQFKSVPVNKWRNPLVLHSTGSISNKTNYSATKAGYRASFHHCFGAVVIEFGGQGEEFFIRQLLADRTGGFYDLDKFYYRNNISENRTVDAVVLGDEHVLFMDQRVKEATFSNVDSIVNCLKPKFIVRHDVLDSYSISHHHEHNFLTKYNKNLHEDKRSIENELEISFAHIIETTPSFSKSVVIESNHHDHLKKWLNHSDPKMDLVNAKFYHKLMYYVLDAIENGDKRSPFVIAGQDMWKLSKKKVEFTDDSFEVNGVQLSMHGDKGPNGSRGSLNNLSKIGEKSIIGHSHTPGIQSGCWQVGTSSIMNLEYVSGPSSWLHTHCVIHKNGKRQLITIINGKWRA